MVAHPFLEMCFHPPLQTISVVVVVTYGHICLVYYIMLQINVLDEFEIKIYYIKFSDTTHANL